MFGRSFNFKRHMAVCKKKSVEATKSDMEAMMLEMTQAERQYRQKLEVGETVSTLLNSNEHLSEDSLSNEYKKALKMYRQSQVQHVSVYEHATLKPWQKEVLTFIQQPTHREVIWVVGQKGGEGKTFLQNYIKYYSYIKASVVPQAQRMSGHHRVNIKMFQCPDCGKEFTRKFNMERHRIVSHGDSNNEADSEESFDHGTDASDERDSSDEQESIADEGDKGDDDNSDGDEDEDEDDNSSSDSQNSTDDEDDDDSVWSGIRDLSWTSKLLSTFNEAKKEFQNEGMTVDEAIRKHINMFFPN